MTHEEWLAEGTRRFGPDQCKWRFVCPSCGYVASAQEWVDAAAPQAIAFSCVGRWTGANDNKTFQKAGGPCCYAGGGLIGLNPVKVTMSDGKTLDVFAFADEAKAPVEKG